MKILIILTIGIFILALLYFTYLAYQSQKGSPLGLDNNQLHHCPDTPNCINSEFAEDSAHFIEALPYENESIDKLINIINDSIINSGGEIASKQENYISATFSSKIFRYVDDFEVRIDKENKLIHFRSASRVGKSDFGANKKRILLIKDKINSEAAN